MPRRLFEVRDAVLGQRVTGVAPVLVAGLAHLVHLCAGAIRFVKGAARAAR